MKILAVCTSTKVFGAETVILNILEGLQREGHEVIAATTFWTDGHFDAELDKRGIARRGFWFGAIVRNWRWPYCWWTLNALVKLPSVWWGMSRLLKEYQPDLLMVSSPRHMWVLWPLLGNVPVVMETQFCPAVDDQSGERPFVLADQKLDGWFACSAYIKQRLVNMGIAEEKVHVVKSATIQREGEFSEVPSPPQNAEPIIGILGQIEAWKGHEDLIRAAAILRDRGLQFRIWVFGGGAQSYREHLDRLIAKLSLTDRIDFKGYATSKRIMYQDLDICATPSRFADPYPTVVMEAAAFGVPVVGSDRGGLPELIVDGETGFTVPGEAPDLLAEKLEILINDDALRMRMREAALNRADTVFARPRMIKDFSLASEKVITRWRRHTVETSS